MTKNPTLKNFWSLETIGFKDPLGTKSDENALAMFGEIIKFENGRYQVTWPWKANVSLPDNYKVAIERMKSLAWRFQTDPKLLCNYDDIIKQQLQQKVIEIVDTTEESKF